MPTAEASASCSASPAASSVRRGRAATRTDHAPDRDNDESGADGPRAKTCARRAARAAPTSLELQPLAFLTQVHGTHDTRKLWALLGRRPQRIGRARSPTLSSDVIAKPPIDPNRHAPLADGTLPPALDRNAIDKGKVSMPPPSKITTPQLQRAPRPIRSARSKCRATAIGAPRPSARAGTSRSATSPCRSP